jgi:uncharacterized membrane protein
MAYLRGKMKQLSSIGRIFFGIAMAAMGLETIYYRDFPYMLIPPQHTWLNEHVIFIYISGALLFLAGVCIIIQKRLRPISQLLGVALLLVFCFAFVPYELKSSGRYMHFGEWENAAKELALAGGALLIGGWGLGGVIFALTILSFGIDHFLFAKEAADYIPAWIPNHLFWMYFCGSALILSSVAILLRVRSKLAAALLGAMIFIWVVILHIPKAMAAPLADNEGEVTSAFLALAYCGISFFIAGIGVGAWAGASRKARPKPI